MHSKLAGHLPLQDMIANTIESARTKLAAAEGKEEEKKEKKLLAYEKKEHGGHIPSEKEEENEKKSSVIDFTDPDEVEKLASALEAVGDDLIKNADEHNIGKESPQGGLVLPTASPNAGKQNYGKDKSKAHNVPNHTPEIGVPDSPNSAKTSLEDNLKKAPPSTPYPAKGVMKVGEAGEGGLAAKAQKAPAVFKPVGQPTLQKGKAWTPGQGESGGKSKMSEEKCTCPAPDCPVHSKEAKEKKSSTVIALQAALDKKAGKGESMAEEIKEHGHVPTKKEEKAEGKKEEAKDKKSSAAVSFILSKIKEAESGQGGLTLDTPSEEGPKPDSNAAGGNDARSHIGSNKSAIDMKKVEGKKPQKRMLSEVLTEPALSKAHDDKVQENLRNATKGGVKIAAVKEFLQKVAGDPNDPRHEKLAKLLKEKSDGKKEKESNSSQGYGGGLPPVSGTPSPMPMSSPKMM